MNSATDTFVCFDSKLNLVNINKTGLNRWKRKKKDIIGKNVLEIFPQLKKTGRYAKYMEVIKTGKPYISDEIAHFTRPDTYIKVKAFKCGEGLGMIVVDVSDLMKTEIAFLSSEKRYRLVVNKMTDGIAIQDEKGIITYANNKFLEISGRSKGEVFGHSISEFADEENLKIYKKQLARRKKGENQPYELIWNRKDG